MRIKVYITSAYRAYKIAVHYCRKGFYAALSEKHMRSTPAEAVSHADTTFLGLGEVIRI